jgi:hypothetical protein
LILWSLFFQINLNEMWYCLVHLVARDFHNSLTSFQHTSTLMVFQRRASIVPKVFSILLRNRCVELVNVEFIACRHINQDPQRRDRTHRKIVKRWHRNFD